MEQQEQDVVIVGAGIAGLAAAVALKIVGVEKLLVLERSSELRATGAALTLFPNAWRALEVLNVAHKLYPLYHPIQARTVVNLVHGTTHTTSFVRDTDRDKRGIRSVHRKVLLESLVEELPTETIRFSSRLISISYHTKDRSPYPVSLLLGDGSTIKCKALIGCDGVNSMVAQWLGLAPPMDSGRTAFRGLAVFPEPHEYTNNFTQYTDHGKRAGMVPITDKEIYWFISHISSKETALAEKEMAGDPELLLKEVTENLAKNFPLSYLQVVKNSDSSTPTWSSLVFRAPWKIVFGPTHKGCVTVAGDSMHPMTPDLGQGGCAALEDAIVLARNLARAQTNQGFALGIERYVKERRWRVAMLVASSYLNGWLHQNGAAGWWGWMVKWFREGIFIKFIYPRIVDAINYDCGDLPPAQ